MMRSVGGQSDIRDSGIIRSLNGRNNYRRSAIIQNVVQRPESVGWNTEMAHTMGEGQEMKEVKFELWPQQRQRGFFLDLGMSIGTRVEDPISPRTPTTIISNGIEVATKTVEMKRQVGHSYVVATWTYTTSAAGFVWNTTGSDTRRNTLCGESDLSLHSCIGSSVHAGYANLPMGKTFAQHLYKHSK
jgi:hypothetical protein